MQFGKYNNMLDRDCPGRMYGQLFETAQHLFLSLHFRSIALNNLFQNLLCHGTIIIFAKSWVFQVYTLYLNGSWTWKKTRRSLGNSWGKLFFSLHFSCRLYPVLLLDHQNESCIVSYSVGGLHGSRFRCKDSLGSWLRTHQKFRRLESDRLPVSIATFDSRKEINELNYATEILGECGPSATATLATRTALLSRTETPSPRREPTIFSHIGSINQ